MNLHNLLQTETQEEFFNRTYWVCEKWSSKDKTPAKVFVFEHKRFHGECAVWSEEKAKIYLSQLAPGTYRPFIPTLKAINPVQGTEIKITEEDAITGKIHIPFPVINFDNLLRIIP